MIRLNGVWASALLFAVLTGCGGGDSSSPPIQGGGTPTPTPVPSPAPTPDPIGLATLKPWLAQGRIPSSSNIFLDIQSANEPLLGNPVVVNYDDPRIRHLGGRHSQPQTWPRNHMWWPQALSLVANPTYEANGFSYNRTSLVDGYQFILPAGERQFEVYSLDDGYVGGVYVEIDGVRTSSAPLSFGHGNDGRRRWTLVTLPPSASARDIRVITRRASLGEIRLPPSGTLDPRNPQWDAKPRVVIVGDSISEGEGAGHGADSWAVHMAYRLGIDDPVNVSLGGTGYLRRVSTRPNFREHIQDVIDAFGTNRPDVTFIAGGINDCAAFTPQEIGGEARTYFQELRAAAPDMAIVVFGPFGGPGGYNASLAACADAIFAATNGITGIYTIDVSGWVTAENSAAIFSGRPGDPHPVPAGHRYYAERGEAAVRALLAAL